MFDSIVLRFQYRGNNVDIHVVDIDKVMLLDIVNEWVEEAYKLGYVLPQNPSFSYIYMTNQFNIKCDKDLLEMFNTLMNKRLIVIHVVENDKPDELIIAAGRLRKDEISEQPTFDTPQSKASIMNARKIPQSTAARKGLLGSNIDQAKEDVSSSASNGKGKRKMSESPLLIESVEDLGSAGDDLEDEYVPSDINESDSDDMTGFDEDESVELATEPFALDSYRPYAQISFDDGDEDQDEYFSKLYNNGEIYAQQEWGHITLKPWQIFLDKGHFKSVLKDYAIQCGFDYIVEKSNNQRYTVVCSSLDCEWRLHASVLSDGTTWAIKTIRNPDHICSRFEKFNSLVDVKWAASKLMGDIKANNDISGKTLNELLWQRFGVEMKTSTLYKMREFALKEINGGYDSSYRFLPKYCHMVRETNPNSAAFCVWLPADHPQKPLSFTSIFISFKGAIDGVVRGCRSLIGIDEAHLKGVYGGILLSAIALDGNNELFPFAWAIVPKEDEHTWKFFIWHLKNVLKDSGRGDEWTIISDRQKGIDKALDEVWPKAGTRYCTRHLAMNWKKAYPGPLMYSLFWRACNATSKFTYKKAMERLQKASLSTKIWFSHLGDVSTWAKHAFEPAIYCDENTSNFVESFNSTLGIDRCKPVLTLLEGIRRVCMVRMAKRMENCMNWKDDKLCPKINELITTLKNDAKTCKAYPCGQGEYEIRDGKSTLSVSLKEKTCLCNAWQISGIPCKHAVRAMVAAKLDPAKMCSDWFYVKKYKEAYGSIIKTITDPEHWSNIDQPVIQPPR